MKDDIVSHPLDKGIQGDCDQIQGDGGGKQRLSVDDQYYHCQHLSEGHTEREYRVAQHLQYVGVVVQAIIPVETDAQLDAAQREVVHECVNSPHPKGGMQCAEAIAPTQTPDGHGQQIHLRQRRQQVPPIPRRAFAIDVARKHCVSETKRGQTAAPPSFHRKPTMIVFFHCSKSKIMRNRWKVLR